MMIMRKTLFRLIGNGARKGVKNNQRPFCVRSLLPDNGLLGLSTLRSPSDFPELSKEAVNKCKILREEISRITDPLETLLLMDQISNEVCSVIDVAEFCRSAHDSPEYKHEAEESFSMLSSFIHTLNSDQQLYSKLKNIIMDKEIFNNLPKEYQLFALDLTAEFESDGIHLKGDDRKAAVSLQGDVVTSETKFMQNCSKQGDNYEIGPFDSNNHHRFSAWMGQYVEQVPELSEGYIMCSSNKRIAGAVLKSVDDGLIRQKIWSRMMTEPKANQEGLGELVKNRQKLAHILGYKSFAHKFLCNKIIKTPEGVHSFLRNISEVIKPKAQEELGLLIDLKRDLMDGRGIQGKGECELQPWDIAYLINGAQSMQNNGKTDGQLVGQKALSAVSEYLPLDSCIEGLVGITTSLFGITVKVSDLSPMESWLENGNSMNSLENNIKNEKNSNFKNSKLFHENNNFELNQGFSTGAIKCEFSGPQGESIGVVYLDLYQRPHKFPGAAHFTLRCGCSNGKKIENGGPGDGPYQLPIVALSFNFSAPNQGKPILSLNELETIYHEWGHALHSILSRTTFQHLSGTRGAIDFVEVPSHLFEFYARSPSVINQWARHHITGKPIPSGLLEEALKSKVSFGAIEMQTQILYSAADQYMFGADMGDVSALSNMETFDKAVAGVRGLQLKLTDLPLGQFYNSDMKYPYMSLLSHSHFVNYGGGYYSYLFAKMHAAQIWENVLAKDPLARRGGDIIWQKMLRYGAAKDTKDMLTELSGKELKSENFLNNI